MAAPQSAIQNTPTTSYIYVNSLDRYSNGFPPSAGSNQTTCTDITFPLPGLSNIATVQVSSISLVSSWWNQVGLNAFSSAFYTNIINLVDLTTSTTYLITVPEGTTSLTSMVSNLGKYVQASAFGGSAAGSQSFTTAAAANGSYPTYDPVGSPGSFWIWGDTSRSTGQHSFGWSRVTTAPDGTNIANRRQLFDILGLAGHVPSVAGLPLSTGAGYTTIPYSTSGAGPITGPIRFMDMISPQVTNFAPDVNSCSTASSNALMRFSGINLISSQFPGAGVSGKVMKVAPGSTSLRIQLVDDQQNPIPTNFPVPAPYTGTLPTGTGILSSTLSNLTFSAISNASTIFPAGTQVNILTLTGSASGWNPGVYQVQSSTSNTVTIPYLTTSSNQISNATYTFSIAPMWQYNTSANQSGPEYQMTLIGIARTTTA